MARLNFPTITLNRLHRWSGLAAAVWLSVLGLTGLLQANRQWAWQWSSGLPSADLAAKLGAGDDKYLWRHFQVDPKAPAWRVVSGAAGAFATSDAGRSWRRLPFGTQPIRDIQALEVLKGGGFTVLAGTNDGVWRLDSQRRAFKPAGLEGARVTALGASNSQIVAVVGRSRVFRAPIGADGRLGEWRPVELGAPPPGAVARNLDAGRLLQDIHLGRGLFGGPVDRVLLNITGLGLLFLGLSGPLYWLLMKRQLAGRKRPPEARPTKLQIVQMQKAIRWTFRSHASIVGFVLALPLLLSFLTGLYQDHRKDVQMIARRVVVPAVLTPPAYRLQGWRGRIDSIGLASGRQGDVLLMGTRMGVFASVDGGATFTADRGFLGPAMRMRRIGDQVIVPGRMMRRIQVRTAEGWSLLKTPPPVVMANEMTLGADGRVLWQRGDKVFATSAEGRARGVETHIPPQLDYTPWAVLASKVHDGAIISQQWKWVNDVAALLGIMLIITGFLRWRKRIW